MPTLWFSDIQGSTSLLQRVGPLYAELLSRHRQIVRFAIATFSGTERGTEGDSFFVTFDAPTNAIAASVEVQRAHQVEPWPSGAEISVRIGVHTGEASDTSAGLVGLAIHHAARIASAAHGGQIIVSGPARAAVADLPEAIGMRSLGVHQLRDVGEMALFQVTHSDLASHFPPPVRHPPGPHPIRQWQYPQTVNCAISRSKSLTMTAS